MMVWPARLDAESAEFHIAMLNDRGRTKQFLDAIRCIVRPGDVVVDIGTGTGVLAIGAAKAGAAHVYAIEAGRIARWAQQLFKANGVADRVTVIPRWSGAVRLPERADVIVSELIGDDPLAEGVVGITRDALRRFAKPGARLIPSGLRIYGLAVTIPPDALSEFLFTGDLVRKWESWYGMTFEPLQTVRLPALFAHFVNPYLARDWQAAAAPIQLADINLKLPRVPLLQGRHAFTAEKSGEINGLIVYFALEAEGKPLLSTRPNETGEENHWLSPLQVFPEPYPVSVGQELELIYRYNLRSGLSRCRIVPAGRTGRTGRRLAKA